MTTGELARVFLLIGNTTWASGAATLARLRDELVDRRGALRNEQWTLAYAIARVAPGTNVLAFCAGAGWAIRGWPGAIAAVLALQVPASIIIVCLTVLYTRGWFDRLMPGAMAAVTGMIAGGALLLMRPYLRRHVLLRTALFSVGALALLPWLSPVMILLIAGAAGALWRES
jgi:chromate transporter